MGETLEYHADLADTETAVWEDMAGNVVAVLPEKPRAFRKAYGSWTTGH